MSVHAQAINPSEPPVNVKEWREKVVKILKKEDRRKRKVTFRWLLLWVDLYKIYISSWPFYPENGLLFLQHFLKVGDFLHVVPNVFVQSRKEYFGAIFSELFYQQGQLVQTFHVDDLAVPETDDEGDFWIFGAIFIDNFGEFPEVFVEIHEADWA